MYLINFQQVSNSADWVQSLELTSQDDGEPIDLTGASITLQVWRQTNRGQGAATYSWAAVQQINQPILEASTSNGKITVDTDTGTITWTFRASTDMNAVPAGYYEVGMIIAKSPDTVQLLLGVLPVVNGAVR